MEADQEKVQVMSLGRAIEKLVALLTGAKWLRCGEGYVADETCRPFPVRIKGLGHGLMTLSFDVVIITNCIDIC
jgi:hypothetical protein